MTATECSAQAARAIAKWRRIGATIAPMTLSRLRYVTVEGCIGVGKTTLTHLLAERLKGAHESHVQV